jgi:phosphate/sulfate permease
MANPFENPTIKSPAEKKSADLPPIAAEAQPEEAEKLDEEILKSIATELEAQNKAFEAVESEVEVKGNTTEKYEKKKSLLKKTATLLTAAAAYMAFTHGTANKAEASSNLDQIFRQAVNQIANQAAKGIGEKVHDMTRRGGGISPQERNREIREIQKEDNNWDNFYHKLKQRRLNELNQLRMKYGKEVYFDKNGYDREKGVIDEVYNEEISKLNEEHNSRHRMQNGANVTGCRVPNGWPTIPGKNY